MAPPNSDEFSFTEHTWTHGSWIVPTKAEQVQTLLEIMRANDGVLTKRDFLLNSTLSTGGGTPAKMATVEEFRKKNISFSLFLEWFSVRGWDLVETNAITGEMDPYTGKFGGGPDTIRTVKERWCLFRKPFKNSVFVSAELQSSRRVAEEE